LWAEENNIDSDQVLRIAHGRRTIEIVRLLAPQLDAEAEMRRLEAREAADVADVKVIRGAHELIRALPPSRWAVVTSGTRLLAISRLKVGGIPQPPVLVTADDVHEGKPDPAPYRKGAQSLGIAAGECVVIEDAPPGIESAHAAGMRAVALTTTYPASQLGRAEAIVPDLSAIRAVCVDGAGPPIVLKIIEA
jgi:mannitol-1-/sugar-/sorbitol-6-phosphatase